eukprot:675136-Hanusia_phi.AAC.2
MPGGTAGATHCRISVGILNSEVPVVLPSDRRCHPPIGWGWSSSVSVCHGFWSLTPSTPGPPATRLGLVQYHPSSVRTGLNFLCQKRSEEPRLITSSHDTLLGVMIVGCKMPDRRRNGQVDGHFFGCQGLFKEPGHPVRLAGLARLRLREGQISD